MVQQAVQAMNAATPNYTIAVADYTAAIKLDPNNSSLYGSLGTAQKDNKNYTAAETDFTQATTLNPKDAQDFYNLGQTYDLDTQDTKAVTAYASAVKLAPTNASYEIAYGDDLVATGDNKDAVNAFEQGQVNATGPSQTMAADAGLGYTDDNLKDYQDALTAFQQAAAADTNNTSKGVYEEQVGNDYQAMATGTNTTTNIQNAITAYQKAYSEGDTKSEGLDINEGYDDLQLNTAAGDTASLTEYQAASALAPTDTTAQLGIGLAQEHLGYTTNNKADLDAAVSTLTTALNADPTDDNVRTELGYAEHCDGNDTAAAADYNTVIANNDSFSAHAQQLLSTEDPSTASDFYNLGQTDDQSGQTAQAITEYTQAVKLAPTNATDQAALGADELASGQNAAAVTAFQAAVANTTDPKTKAAYEVSEGLADDNLQNFTAAKTVFQQATVDDPTNSTAVEWVGQNDQALGDSKDAITELQEAITLGDTKSAGLYNTLGFDELQLGTVAGDTLSLQYYQDYQANSAANAANPLLGVGMAEEHLGTATNNKTDLNNAVTTLTTAVADEGTAADKDSYLTQLGYAEQCDGNDTLAKQDFTTVVNDKNSYSASAQQLLNNLPKS